MSALDFINNLEQFSLVESPDIAARRDVELLTQKISNMDFEIPNVPQPGKFVAQMRDSKEAPRLCDFKKGTTTLAFIYDGGIVVAADSRASRGTSIGSSTVKKVIEINTYLLGTMAGGAADCSFWERHLARLARLYELRNRERLSVAAASNLLANIFFEYRGYGLSAGTMIAGWDTKVPQQGPKLYFVDNEGTRLKNDVFSCGSGSSFAYGVLDTEYRKDLTYDQAIELGRRAIYHATHRDGGSGGTVLLYHIDANGWKKVIDHEDVNELHYKYAAEKGMEGDDL